jgi:hypothetical protein
MQLRPKFEVQTFLSLVVTTRSSHQTGTCGTQNGKRCILSGFMNKPVHVGCTKNTLFHVVMH